MLAMFTRTRFRSAHRMLWKELTAATMSCLIMCQQDLKNRLVNPSGPGALSLGSYAMAH